MESAQIVQEFNQNDEQIEEFTYVNNTLSYLMNDRYFQYYFEEQRFNLFRTLQLDEFTQYLESSNGIYFVNKENNFFKDETLISKLDSTVISIKIWRSLVIVQFLDSLLIYDEISEQLTTLEIYDNILHLSVGQNLFICTQSRECFRLNDDYSIKRLQFTASHIHQLDNQYKVILDNNTTDYRYNRVALYRDETLVTEMHSIAPIFCDVNEQNLFIGDEMGWIQQYEL